MAIDITRNATHKIFFPSKVASFNVGSPHTYNMTLGAAHDNGDLIVRDVTSWNSFDNYDEDTAGTITFSGIVRGQDADGLWRVEVLSVSQDAVIVYNSPVSEYPQRELQDPGLFYNAEGETAIGGELIRGDQLLLSESAFTGTLAVDAAVAYDASTKKYTI